MWKVLLRPGMIFVPLFCGALLPECHKLGWLIRWLLIVMLFMVFLRLKAKDCALHRSHWRILLANVLMGIVPYALCRFAGANDALSQAAFFVGISPTATAAAVVMGFLEGNVGYVLCSFLVTNLGIAILLPAVLPFVAGEVSWEFVWNVIQSLALVLVLPFALAAIVRKIHPKVSEWPGKLSVATFGLWSLVLFILAADSSNFFRTHPDQSLWLVAAIGGMALVICACNFSLGYLLGEKAWKREASQSLGQKNTTLTIFLALTYAGSLAAMGVIFYVLWHNIWNAVQIFLHDRKKVRQLAETR